MGPRWVTTSRDYFASLHKSCQGRTRVLLLAISKFISTALHQPQTLLQVARRAIVELVEVRVAAAKNPPPFVIPSPFLSVCRMTSVSSLQGMMRKKNDDGVRKKKKKKRGGGKKKKKKKKKK